MGTWACTPVACQLECADPGGWAMLETPPSDPIVEAIFEIHFASKNDAVASVLFAKFLSGKLKERFPEYTRLPIADFPLALRRTTAELRHQPEFRLQGKRETVLIGNQTFVFAVQEPYIGGDEFIKKIVELMEILAEEKKEFDAIGRIAFRYMNLIETVQGAGVDLDRIKFKGSVAGYDLSMHDTLVKFQVNEKLLFHTIQIKNNTTLTNNITGNSKTGLLVDIVTGRTSGLDKFWSECPRMVGDLRAAERVVFEKIIKERSLERYRIGG